LDFLPFWAVALLRLMLRLAEVMLAEILALTVGMTKCICMK